MEIANSENSVNTLTKRFAGNTEPSLARGRCNDHPYMGVGRKARPKHRASLGTMIWSVLHGNMQQSKDVCEFAIRREQKDGNSVPYSGKLEALSKFEVRKPVMQALRNDAVKTFDRAAWVQFDAAPLKVVPATAGTSTTVLTLTTNGTATATNNIAFQKEHAKLVVDLMKERNIPAYSNDDYVGIAWPTALRRLKNDLEGIHQYTSAGIQLIFNAEIGRYENVRYVEQTNIPKGISTDGLTGTAWASGNDWIFFFGEDTVAEGVACPEEMRAKIPTDYGRSKGVAWYYLGGFGLVQTAASQARIVQWDSAA